MEIPNQKPYEFRVTLPVGTTKPGDLIRTHTEVLGWWRGSEWKTMPVRWSQKPYRVLAVEAEGKRLLVIEEPRGAEPSGFGVTAEWCAPYP